MIIIEILLDEPEEYLDFPASAVDLCYLKETVRPGLVPGLAAHKYQGLPRFSLLVPSITMYYNKMHRLKVFYFAPFTGECGGFNFMYHQFLLSIFRLKYSLNHPQVLSRVWRDPK